MRYKKYRRQPWVSPKIEIRASSIHGKGMYAREAIRQGEIVAIWGGVYVSKHEAEKARKVSDNRIQQIDDDVFEVFSWEKRGDDPTHFHNHSCDPNTWMEDEVTIAARREIKTGEELTIDYAMFEADENFLGEWSCLCGSSLCRRRVTGKDWRLPDLQRRYESHFSPLINKRIVHDPQV